MSWLADWAKDNLKEEKGKDRMKPEDTPVVPSFQSQQLFDPQHKTWCLRYKQGNTLHILHTRAHNPTHARKRMMLEWFALGGTEVKDDKFLSSLSRNQQPLTVLCRHGWSGPLKTMESVISLGWMEAVAPDRLHIFKLDLYREQHPGVMMVQAHDVVEARKIMLQAVKEQDVDDNTFPYATSFDCKTVSVQVNTSPNPTVPMSAKLGDLSWAVRLGYLEMVAQSVVYFCGLDG